jgi:hypothetical protein
MSLLGITPSGQLYEIDSADHETNRPARLPQTVEESSTVLNPQTFNAQLKARENKAMGQARAYMNKKAKEMGALKAKRAHEHAMNRAMSRPQPLMGEDKIVADGMQTMLRQKSVDFDRYQLWNAGGDFGSENNVKPVDVRGIPQGGPVSHYYEHGGYGTASPQNNGLLAGTMGYDTTDYQEQSIYGNPLTPDACCGPITDFERFMLESPEGGVRGNVPGGLNPNGQAVFPGVASQNKISAAGGQPAPMGYFAHPMSRLGCGTMPLGAASPLVKRGRAALRGAMGDDTTTNTFDVGPPPDAPPDPMAPPPPDTSVSFDTATIDMSATDGSQLPPSTAVDISTQPAPEAVTAPAIDTSTAASAGGSTGANVATTSPSFLQQAGAALVQSTPTFLQQLQNSMSRASGGTIPMATTAKPGTVAVAATPMSQNTKLMLMLAAGAIGIGILMKSRGSKSTAVGA